MVRGEKIAAEIVTLRSGRCVVSWPTSTIVYDSIEAAIAVHVEHMKGRGEPTRFEQRVFSKAWDRGATEAAQDDMEGVFARCARQDDYMPEIVVPLYIPANQAVDWLEGYRDHLALSCGSDWRSIVAKAGRICDGNQFALNTKQPTS